jgi:hypothetical protein
MSSSIAMSIQCPWIFPGTSINKCLELCQETFPCSWWDKCKTCNMCSTNKGHKLTIRHYAPQVLLWPLLLRHLLALSDVRLASGARLSRVHQRWECTGNGLVVPSSSHKWEVAGSIPGWVHKKLFSPLFRCHLTDWLHTLMFGAIYPPQKSA